jgi:hypothetical protein
MDPRRLDLRWMLRVYPRPWRDRYEDEVGALLEQRGGTAATVVDLLLGTLVLAPLPPRAVVV